MFFISTEALKGHRNNGNWKATLSCVYELGLRLKTVFRGPAIFIFFALFCPLVVCVIHWNPFLGCHPAVGLALDFCSATHTNRAILLFQWCIEVTGLCIFYYYYHHHLNLSMKRDIQNPVVEELEKLGFISYLLRNRTQSWCPYISAILAGLSPQQSSLSIGAWSECSSRSTASRPASAAQCAAVHPCSVLRHGLAPRSMRTLTVSVCPVYK